MHRAQPRGAEDPNVILTITFKNWAALDGLEDRINAMEKKIRSDRAGISKAHMDREALREVLGSEDVQQLVLK